MQNLHSVQSESSMPKRACQLNDQSRILWNLLCNRLWTFFGVWTLRGLAYQMDLF